MICSSARLPEQRKQASFLARSLFGCCQRYVTPMDRRERTSPQAHRVILEVRTTQRLHNKLFGCEDLISRMIRTRWLAALVMRRFTRRRWPFIELLWQLYRRHVPMFVADDLQPSPFSELGSNRCCCHRTWVNQATFIWVLARCYVHVAPQPRRTACISTTDVLESRSCHPWGSGRLGRPVAPFSYTSHETTA